MEDKNPFKLRFRRMPNLKESAQEWKEFFEERPEKRELAEHIINNMTVTVVEKEEDWE